MKSWHVSSSKDGYFITAEEFPWAPYALEQAHGWVCWATRGWLGGHGLPEVFFNIPFGKAIRDEDGDMENSIGMKLYDFEQWVCNWEYRHHIRHFHTGISEKTARQIDPRLVAIIEDLYKD